MAIEYHTASFECEGDIHRAFLPALGTKITYRDHTTLVEGIYALYEREYGPNDIHILDPYDCPAAPHLEARKEVACQ